MLCLSCTCAASRLSVSLYALPDEWVATLAQAHVWVCGCAGVQPSVCERACSCAGAWSMCVGRQLLCHP